MLIYFEPASLCTLPPSLLLSPLPSKKQLWEAKDANTWKFEISKDTNLQTSFALAATGELLELEQSPMGCTNAILRHNSSSNEALEKENKGWEEWCSGMDNFGGLVVLAASLIG